MNPGTTCERFAINAQRIKKASKKFGSIVSFNAFACMQTSRDLSECCNNDIIILRMKKGFKETFKRLNLKTEFYLDGPDAADLRLGRRLMEFANECQGKEREDVPAFITRRAEEACFLSDDEDDDTRDEDDNDDEDDDDANYDDHDDGIRNDLRINRNNNDDGDGNVSISSLERDIIINDDINAFSFSQPGDAGNGGKISLVATSGNISGDESLFTSSSIVIEEDKTSGTGGLVHLESESSISNIEILTGSSSGRSGNVIIKGLGDLTIEGLLLNTSDQFSIIDPFNNKDNIKAPVDFSLPGSNLIFSESSLILNNVDIIASTAGKQQAASILVDVSDILLLRQGSFINAEATGDGSGGNIRIDAGFLVALPNENSDIIANSFGGTGGIIDITAKQVFGFTKQIGLETDELRNNTISDISASSKFGLQGIINITTLNEDLNRSFNELPIQVETPEPLQTCQTAEGEPIGSFISTGRSGSPLDPTEPLSNPDIWEDAQPLSEQISETSISNSMSLNSESKQSSEAIVAGGWVVNDRGEVELVETMPININNRGCPIS